MTPISILKQTGNVNIVVRAAIERNGRYLVVQESKKDCYGKWAFVGGKVDVGEYLSQAIIREVLEETGVTIEVTGILGVRDALWDDRPGFSIEFFFLSEAVAIPDTFPIVDEILAVAWKSLDELLEMKEKGELRNPSQEAVITFLQNGHSLPVSHFVENTSTNVVPEP